MGKQELRAQAPREVARKAFDERDHLRPAISHMRCIIKDRRFHTVESLRIAKRNLANYSARLAALSYVLALSQPQEAP